jgi:hypothetical protein
MSISFNLPPISKENATPIFKPIIPNPEELTTEDTESTEGK